jgi:hypothetical protein
MVLISPRAEDDFALGNDKQERNVDVGWRGLDADDLVFAKILFDVGAAEGLSIERQPTSGLLRPELADAGNAFACGDKGSSLAVRFDVESLGSDAAGDNRSRVCHNERFADGLGGDAPERLFEDSLLNFVSSMGKIVPGFEKRRDCRTGVAAKNGLAQRLRWPGFRALDL